jgi:hypothetical protein
MAALHQLHNGFIKRWRLELDISNAGLIIDFLDQIDAQTQFI